MNWNLPAAWKAKCRQLKELLNDREQDLDFEYKERIAAEKRTVSYKTERYHLIIEKDDLGKRVAELESAMGEMLHILAAAKVQDFDGVTATFRVVDAGKIGLTAMGWVTEKEEKISDG